jgi:hypothetical protein
MEAQRRLHIDEEGQQGLLLQGEEKTAAILDDELRFFSHAVAR